MGFDERKASAPNAIIEEVGSDPLPLTVPPFYGPRPLWSGDRAGQSDGVFIA